MSIDLVVGGRYAAVVEAETCTIWHAPLREDAIQRDQPTPPTMQPELEADAPCMEQDLEQKHAPTHLSTSASKRT